VRTKSPIHGLVREAHVVGSRSLSSTAEAASDCRTGCRMAPSSRALRCNSSLRNAVMPSGRTLHVAAVLSASGASSGPASRPAPLIDCRA
jgi:hypothetical protein